MHRGFSVLISCYAWDVSALVAKLHQQAEALCVPYEILIGDNCSPSGHFTQANLKTEKLPNVTLIQFDKPQDRTQLRIKLAEKAQHNALLFLDGDCNLYKPDFLKNYLESRGPSQVTVCGGISYQKQTPARAQSLRWMHGVSTKQKPAKQRNKTPYLFFSFFNVLIAKTVFFDIYNNNFHCEPGFEDMIFGVWLKKNNIAVKHINNPTQHLGPTSNIAFLKKVTQSVPLFYSLVQTYPCLKRTTWWKMALFVSKFAITPNRKQRLHSHLVAPPQVAPHTAFVLRVYKAVLLAELIKNQKKKENGV